MTQVIFVSGAHGVGKGTLCQSLQKKLGYSIYSCSDLIKKYSGYIEIDKFVNNSGENQLSLLAGLRDIDEEIIFLDGHFCLAGEDGQIVELSYEVFDAINPYKIVNVTCDESTVHQRLLSRDGTSLGVGVLISLQIAESKRATDFAKTRQVPFVNYASGSDENKLIEWLVR